MAISRAFAQLGHEVLLLGVAGHGAAPQEHRSHLLPHPGRAEGLVRERNKLALVDRFAVVGREVLDAFAPDLIYERLSLFGTAGIDLARSTGAPHVVEVNALLAREEAAWRGLRLVGEATAREADVVTSADHMICVSDEVAAQVREQRRDQVSVVANGFDEAAFSGSVDRARVRAQHGLPPQSPVAVFVGTLRPWHGVENALRAVRRLPDGLMLAVVGDGPGRATLEREAERLGVAHRVRFLGHLPQREVADLLRSVDLALAPYPPLRDFAFSPLKVYEYLAAGLPWIASDIGQLRDVADEFGGGTLVPAGDQDALAAAMAAVLADPEAIDRAKTAQGRAFARCGWRARASEILEAVGHQPVGASR
jgi:glycosyltransferase involved in cell wall biosynthesis